MAVKLNVKGCKGYNMDAYTMKGFPTQTNEGVKDGVRD